MAQEDDVRSGAPLRRRLERVGLPSVGIAVALAGFELAPRVGVLPRSSFPPTSEVAASLADLAGTTELWVAVGHTMGSWARAMLVATLIAVPLGLVIGASRTAASLCLFTIEFLRPIPSVALIPVFVLIYGTRPTLTVALGTFAAAFPLLFQAMYGVVDADPVAKEMARAFGLGWWLRVRHIVLPSCASHLAAGLRISASVALTLVVTGEYVVVGVPGLGQEVYLAQSGGAYDRAYAWILVTGVLGLVVNLGFHAMERHALQWHPSQLHREAERL
jgi:ABC-type nitrate/sulfonate/bicarbonate transport system permease component